MGEYDDHTITDLVDATRELTRTLRGHNGDPGLLTQFALLNHQVKDIAEEVKSIRTNGCDVFKQGKIAYVQAKSDTSSKPENNASKPAKENDNSQAEQNAITFRWLIEKLTLPIVVAFIVGIINAILIAKFIAPLIP